MGDGKPEEVAVMKKVVVMAVAVALGLALAGGATEAKEKQASKGMAAVEHAAKAKKYLFMFFYSDGSEQTASMRKIFNDAVDKVSKKAEQVKIDVTDAAEATIIDKYSVRGAPMPLVLAIAPNGAITGGFAAPFEEKQILDAFATPCTQASLKALQERKVVLLCVQNGKTKLNGDAMKGVNEFKADPAYATSTEIITVDPSDPKESKLLETLAIDPKIDQAMTVCLVPPGQAAAKLTGATTKQMIANSLKGGGGGCCPGGAKGGATSCGPAPSGQAAAKPGGTSSPSTPGGTKPGGK